MWANVVFHPTPSDSTALAAIREKEEHSRESKQKRRLAEYEKWTVETWGNFCHLFSSLVLGFFYCLVLGAASRKVMFWFPSKLFTMLCRLSSPPMVHLEEIKHFHTKVSKKVEIWNQPSWFGTIKNHFQTGHHFQESFSNRAYSFLWEVVRKSHISKSMDYTNIVSEDEV